MLGLVTGKLERNALGVEVGEGGRAHSIFLREGKGLARSGLGKRKAFRESP